MEGCSMSRQTAKGKKRRSRAEARKIKGHQDGHDKPQAQKPEK